MAVVAVVSGTTEPDRVIFEAARQADEREADVHVLYVLGLSWYSTMEVTISDRFGIPTGIETIRSVCERKAARVAEPVLEEYEAVGLVGQPIEEVREYAQSVDADCVVLDGDGDWGGGISRLSRDPLTELREHDVPVVPVY